MASTSALCAALLLYAAAAAAATAQNAVQIDQAQFQAFPAKGVNGDLPVMSETTETPLTGYNARRTLKEADYARRPLSSANEVQIAQQMYSAQRVPGSDTLLGATERSARRLLQDPQIAQQNYTAQRVPGSDTLWIVTWTWEYNTDITGFVMSFNATGGSLAEDQLATIVSFEYGDPVMELLTRRPASEVTNVTEPGTIKAAANSFDYTQFRLYVDCNETIPSSGDVCVEVYTTIAYIITVDTGVADAELKIWGPSDPERLPVIAKIAVTITPQPPSPPPPSPPPPSPPPPPSYDWALGSWGTCSEICGGGTQSRLVQCVSSLGVVVGDSVCTESKPDSSQSCNTQACVTYDWSQGSWGACSETCGGGTRSRTVQCVSSLGAVVGDSACTGSKPDSSQSCNTQACVTYGWSEGPWDACSETCGGGTRSRTVQCVSSLGVVVGDSACTGSKPDSSQSCNTQACLTYNWSEGSWGACSETCGGGTRSRTVQCVSLLGVVVGDSACIGSKPDSSQSCNTQACVTYGWSEGSWGACSEACGGGTRSRTVQCVSSLGAVVSDSACTGSKPDSSQSCNTQACVTYGWSEGSWGACSETCGGGNRSRTVQCVSSLGAVVSDSACTGSKPDSSQSCNTQACVTYSWRPSDWGECSRSCNTGTHSRTVECQSDLDGETVDDSACAETRPATTQNCNTHACEGYGWVEYDWRACSQSCGGGTQTRLVRCESPSGQGVAVGYCRGPIPLAARLCNTQPCATESYEWEANNWGTCSATCGGGMQSRTVECVSSSGTAVDDSECAETKPVSSQECNTQACTTYSWNKGSWGTCSESCGGGMQSRTVECVSPVGTGVADSECAEAKPASSQSCNTQACLTYEWDEGSWGTCSETCGGGNQSRTVQCMSSLGVAVSDSECGETKPASSQSCNTQACVPYSWTEGSWGTCSETCGGGTQIRLVQCASSGDGVAVVDSACTGPKPAESRTCNVQACDGLDPPGAPPVSDGTTSSGGALMSGAWRVWCLAYLSSSLGVYALHV
eukprot:scaffold3619_cov328-Prasinococcus_capsulatus_cf.AAC.12